jgi:hypothetical protein
MADCTESHPYLFIRGWQGRQPFRLSEMAGVSGTPRLNERQKKLKVPIIINEYCWLWLNRDGTPTCLTEKVYEGILGKRSTVEQRRQVHARYVAALTEFWRCHRQCAGVLHFCGLGYSRRGDRPRPEGGATSDHWIDVEKLEFEPTFEKHLRDAFNPVGVMLDFWAERISAGGERVVKVYIINDLETEWRGEVRLVLRLKNQEDSLSVSPIHTRVKGWDRKILSIPLALPTVPGDYTLAAELVRTGQEPVRSVREIKLIHQATTQQ